VFHQASLHFLDNARLRSDAYWVQSDCPRAYRLALFEGIAALGTGIKGSARCDACRHGEPASTNRFGLLPHNGTEGRIVRSLQERSQNPLCHQGATGLTCARHASDRLTAIRSRRKGRSSDAREFGGPGLSALVTVKPPRDGRVYDASARSPRSSSPRHDSNGQSSESRHTTFPRPFSRRVQVPHSCKKASSSRCRAASWRTQLARQVDQVDLPGLEPGFEA